MMAEEFESLELPVPPSSQLYVESGLEWLRDNTTLEFDITDIESVKALPSSARLFLVKFSEVCSRDTGVTGESVGPMSQNFTTDSVERQTMSLARQLLKAYLKPNVKFIPCKRRWC
ncbi:hypothetical protein C0033_08885 [Clostridium sp. chh4-2]|uniref:hypothetical protein n=1 Tax=Clostridium sp. chh4-2 TaxID=2067550 RepID=UPI000CCE4DA6|nr:hypothetical protein [Clostridium sp. chh4-2]PNV62218.1 hypothetical protein C0033_08885 [Clostridium sp. chh4-2]